MKNIEIKDLNRWEELTQDSAAVRGGSIVEQAQMQMQGVQGELEKMLEAFYKDIDEFMGEFGIEPEPGAGAGIEPVEQFVPGSGSAIRRPRRIR